MTAKGNMGRGAKAMKFDRFVQVRVDDELYEAIERRVQHEKIAWRSVFPGVELNLSTLLRPLLWHWAHDVPRETSPPIDDSCHTPSHKV
jgi:hypothetical protein